jgi:MFS family permease
MRHESLATAISPQSAFSVSTATASWLISGFYLAAAIGMPVMGRLADLAVVLAAISARLLVASIGARRQREGLHSGESLGGS